MKTTPIACFGALLFTAWLGACKQADSGAAATEGTAEGKAEGTAEPTAGHPGSSPATSPPADTDRGAGPNPPDTSVDAERPDGGRLPDVEVWMPPDAGVRDNPDPTMAADGSRVCSPLLLAIGQETGPACTAETGMCVVACELLPDAQQDACRDACAAADTYVGGGSDCGGCIGLRPLACFDDNGCSIDPLYCCLEDNCQLGDDGCTQAKCSVELQALFGCVAQTPAALACLDYQNGRVSTCFAPPADAGT